MLLYALADTKKDEKKKRKERKKKESETSEDSSSTNLGAVLSLIKDTIIIYIHSLRQWQSTPKRGEDIGQWHSVEIVIGRSWVRYPAGSSLEIKGLCPVLNNNWFCLMPVLACVT